MAPRWDTAETLLTSSQHVRDELMAAVGRLDNYIDLLKVELAQRESELDGSAAPGEPQTS